MTDRVEEALERVENEPQRGFEYEERDSRGWNQRKYRGGVLLETSDRDLLCEALRLALQVLDRHGRPCRRLLYSDGEIEECNCGYDELQALREGKCSTE